MNPRGESPLSGQIPFNQELARKATHLTALVIPSGYYLLDFTKLEMLSVMLPLTLLVVIIDISRLRNGLLWNNKLVSSLFSRMIRVHEAGGDFTGAFYILVAVCVTVALFSKSVAVAALAFVVVGDTIAAIIGRLFGKHRFGNSKSVEGSLGCLLGTVVVAGVTPNLAFGIGIAGAITATVVEALPFGVDDNLTIPLASGLVMTLVIKIVGNI